MANVTIMDHPLIQHKIGIMRRKETSTKEFRDLVSEVAMLICCRLLNERFFFFLNAFDNCPKSFPLLPFALIAIKYIHYSTNNKDNEDRKAYFEDCFIVLMIIDWPIGGQSNVLI